MYRVRTRPAYTEEQLKELYATPHDHTQWPDHIQRVQQTIQQGRALLRHYPFDCVTIADLSCGDATIATALAEDVCCHDLILGDYAPGYPIEGPIERTIENLPGEWGVDLFVCCETLEHLDDPDSFLYRVRTVSSLLLLSTPSCDFEDDNPEHYWAWDTEAVGVMLGQAGWRAYNFELVTPDAGYKYQIWGCQ